MNANAPYPNADGLVVEEFYSMAEYVVDHHETHSVIFNDEVDYTSFAFVLNREPILVFKYVDGSATVYRNGKHRITKIDDWMVTT